MMVDELLDLTRSDAGIPGEAAGFGQVTASVDDKVGTPGVKVTASGDDTAKNFAFAFTGLKGVQGDQGYSAYQLARQDGYTGSVQEWLASLRFSIDQQVATKANLPSGKTKGYRVQTLDDRHVYEYDGSKWMDLGTLAANYEARQVFSVALGDSGRAWFDRRGWMVDCWVTFKAFAAASMSSAVLDRLLAPQMGGVFPTVTIGPALSVPVGETMPALDATAIGPQMMLQVTDKLVLTRVDSKTPMPALAAGRLYCLHLRYRATNEMLESRPVYYTQRVSADANAASVLTDQYTYRTSGNGPSILNIMD